MLVGMIANKPHIFVEKEEGIYVEEEESISMGRGCLIELALLSMALPPTTESK